MTENPLRGLSVPSAAELADEIVQLFGNVRLDLSLPQHRNQLRVALTQVIGHALQRTETALIHSQEKAVRHVFNLIKDEHYQNKRLKRKADKRRQTIDKKFIHTVTPTVH